MAYRLRSLLDWLPSGFHEHTVVTYSQNWDFWLFAPALRPARSFTTTSASSFVRLGNDTFLPIQHIAGESDGVIKSSDLVRGRVAHNL